MLGITHAHDDHIAGIGDLYDRFQVISSKPGGPFKRVEKGTYTLADAPTAATTSAGGRKPAARKRTPTRKTATARSKARTASSPRTRVAAKRTR